MTIAIRDLQGTASDSSRPMLPTAAHASSLSSLHLCESCSSADPAQLQAHWQLIRLVHAPNKQLPSSDMCLAACTHLQAMLCR